MDNQQQKVSEVEVAWLGGFIDADGCIGGLRGQNQRYMPSIYITNSDSPTIEYIAGLLKRMGLAFNITSNKPNPQTKRVVQIVRVMGIKRAKRALPLIIPYLKTKQHQAILLLEYCEARMQYPQKHPYTEHEEELLQRITNMHGFKGIPRYYAQRLNAELHNGDGIVRPA